MKRKFLAALITGLFMLGMAGTASALTYVEDFETPFPAWESGWLGANSDLQNYYTVYGHPSSYRGNNADGLWISDGNTQNGGALTLTQRSEQPWQAFPLISPAIAQARCMYTTCFQISFCKRA